MKKKGNGIGRICIISHIELSRDEKQILNNGGGFVLKDKPISDDKRKHRKSETSD